MKTRIFLPVILILSFLTSCDLYEDIFDKREDEPGFVTDADGNIYPTVTIGKQVWMAENLKTMKYRDSTAIYTTTCPAKWSGLTRGAYCWYKNDVSFKATYGALYNWDAVKTGKLCPKGWHVPTREEWAKLEYFLGGASAAGGKMKSAAGWNSPNTDATNSSNFSGLPGGARRQNGNYDHAGGGGHWWSSTEEPANNAWGCYLLYNTAFFTTYIYTKTNGLSIRCIKD
jgi:uncharacterized protein (TIGR02145 family)